MKIGIFGGSFNPPHKMHKQIAIDMINKKYVDKVIYVPTGNKYQKKDLVDQKDRYNMVQLMIKDNPRLEVSDYELKSNLTYTYQTLEYFKNKYPQDEIYFICGTDNLKEITTWKNHEYILDNYKLLVIKRDNDEIKEITKNLNNKNIVEVNILKNNISSTFIRNNFNKLEDLSLYIDENVLKYIEKEKLYFVKE